MWFLHSYSRVGKPIGFSKVSVLSSVTVCCLFQHVSVSLSPFEGVFNFFFLPTSAQHCLSCSEVESYSICT